MARKNEKENLLTQTAGKNQPIWWHIFNSHKPTHRPKIAKEYAFPNAPEDRQTNGRKEQRRHNTGW